MIESLMFYAYTFSEIIGFCTIFLIVLLYRRKTSDQMLPLKNLGCFQIFALGIGMIYFAHRYLSIYNGDKTYVTLLRGADITFFILMQFYWLHYLQKSIQIVSEKIKKAVKCANAAIAVLLVLSVINYTVLVNLNYYVEAEPVRRYVSGIQLLLCIFLTLYNILEALYAFKHSEQKQFKYFILPVTFAVSGICLWNGIAVIYMFSGSAGSGIWSGNIFDPTPFFLFFIGIMNLIHVYRTDFNTLYYSEEKEAHTEIMLTELFDSYGLTAREREITILAAEGKSYDEIAQLLFISKYTVKRHIHNIYQKFEISTRAELMRLVRV